MIITWDKLFLPLYVFVARLESYFFVLLFCFQSNNLPESQGKHLYLRNAVQRLILYLNYDESFFFFAFLDSKLYNATLSHPRTSVRNRFFVDKKWETSNKNDSTGIEKNK